MKEFFIEYAWLLWDFLVVGVLISLVRSGVNRGFMRMIVGFAGYAAAAAVSAWLSPMLAQALYERVIYGRILALTSGRAGEVLSGGESGLGDLTAALPDWLGRILNSTDTSFLTTVLEGDLAQSFGLAVGEAARAPVQNILRAVIFFALFSLCLFLVRRISYLFGGLNRLPIVGGVNALLGGLLGVAQGLLIIYVTALLLQLIIVLTGDTLPVLNTATIGNTFVLRVFYNML